MSGWLFDVTDNYNYLFFTFGGALAASGLLWLLEPKLGRIETAKAKRMLKEISADKSEGCNGGQKLPPGADANE